MTSLLLAIFIVAAISLARILYSRRARRLDRKRMERRRRNDRRMMLMCL